jgi:hypothetical protein
MNCTPAARAIDSITSTIQESIVTAITRGFEVGQRVRVRQRVRTREAEWSRDVEGEVLAVDWQPTGSWYAHGRHDRLWLPRLRLRKDDGEETLFVLDRDTEVTIIEG